MTAGGERLVRMVLVAWQHLVEDEDADKDEEGAGGECDLVHRHIALPILAAPRRRPRHMRVRRPPLMALLHCVQL